MGDDRPRLLGARQLGFARERRIGRLERLHVDRSRCRRQTAQREPRPAEHVLPLTERNSRKQASALGSGQLTARATHPRKPAEPPGIGSAPAARVRVHGVGDRPIIGAG
jgi:hypothetical protein